MTVPELNEFGAVQGANEANHQDAYGKFTFQVIAPGRDQVEVLEEWQTRPGLKEKIAWAQESLSADGRRWFALRATALNLVESLGFTSQFLLFGKMNAVSQWNIGESGEHKHVAQRNLNSWVNRDEGLHVTAWSDIIGILLRDMDAEARAEYWRRADELVCGFMRAEPKYLASMELPGHEHEQVVSLEELNENLRGVGLFTYSRIRAATGLTLSRDIYLAFYRDGKRPKVSPYLALISAQARTNEFEVLPVYDAASKSAQYVDPMMLVTKKRKSADEAKQ